MRFFNKALLIDESLVIADLHLGYEQALEERGIFLPQYQFNQIKSELEKIFFEIDKIKNKKAINKKQKINNKKVNEIIILGDLKHEFSGVLSQEWREVIDLLNFLKKKCGKIILIRGNHDNYLVSVIKKLGIKLEDYYVKNEICFLHGHKIFSECLKENIEMIVIGHRHPAIVLSDKYKKERYKCFLIGNWKNK